MPDPADPTPVRVVKAGSRFVVVDRNGKRLQGAQPFSDAEAAGKLRDQVNSTWKGAKAERKSKGSPEVTTEAALQAAIDAAASGGGVVALSEWRPLETPEQFASREFKIPHAKKPFNEGVHPRARGGKWAKKLGAMKVGDRVDVKGGVSVERTAEGYRMRHQRQLGEGTTHKTVDDAAAAAERVEKVGTESGEMPGVAAYTSAIMGPARERELAAQLRRSRLKEALDELAAELEEWPISHGMTKPFDPRLHGRDRRGKFEQMVGGLGHRDAVELPGGITVKRGVRGYHVAGGAGRGSAHMRSPAGAVAEALDRHDRAEFANGADPEKTHFARIAEMAEGRRAAMKDSLMDAGHIETLMRTARKERSARMEPFPKNRRGRSKAAVAAYQQRHRTLPSG